MNGRSINNLKTNYVNETTSLTCAINMKAMLNYSYSELCETFFWEYFQRSLAFYKIDSGNSHELTYDSSTRKVSKLYDQSLSQDDAEQTTSSLQPKLCNKADRINNRYYLQINGSQKMISNIDLNQASGEEDIANVFIVYKLKFFSTSYWTCNGLFGNDAMGFHKFISFGHNGDLVISSTVNDHIVIGQNAVNGRSPIAPYKTKTNVGVLHKWICLSVHWNIPTEISYVYCNGKKLCNFQALPRTGANKLTFWDNNPSGKAPLYGEIACFLLHKNRRITERDIKLHHHVLCAKWYNIDHDPITF